MKRSLPKNGSMQYFIPNTSPVCSACVHWSFDAIALAQFVFHSVCVKVRPAYQVLKTSAKSNFLKVSCTKIIAGPGGETGRHIGLKIRRLPEKGRAGSIPAPGTKIHFHCGKLCVFLWLTMCGLTDYAGLHRHSILNLEMSRIYSSQVISCTTSASYKHTHCNFVVNMWQ